MTQQNAALVEQSAAAAESPKEQSGRMNEGPSLCSASGTAKALRRRQHGRRRLLGAGGVLFFTLALWAAPADT